MNATPNLIRLVAPADLLHLLHQAPNIAAATAELASIRKEIEEMKQREDVDDLD
jgi:hypothetical protein